MRIGRISGGSGTRLPGLVIVLGLVAAASLGINVLQGCRILALDNQIDGLQNRTPVEEAVFPSLRVTDVSGHQTSIDYKSGDKKTVLYIFSPACVWCQRNAFSLSTLVQGLPPGYRIFGVSLSDSHVDAFVKSTHISFPVYTIAAESSKESYPLRSTPETIVIGSDGRVIKA